jgi:hypothetical protein
MKKILALTPSLEVTAYTTIQRLRELPLAGTILVKEGDVVGAQDVIAKAAIPGELIVIRIPERMGLEAFEIVAGMQVKEGDVVKVGDLLCEHKGLFGFFKTKFFAPEVGIVEFFSATTGHLGIRQSSTELLLTAYVPGKIVRKKDSFSVTIECECAFVQGVFGVGGVRHGTLEVLNKTFQREVVENDIPNTSEGKVLVGALQCAAQRGATGFITGSIDDATLKGYLGYDVGIALTGDEKVTMTLIITEGFGELPISHRAQSIFIAADGGYVSLDGSTQVRAGAVRPEVILLPQKVVGDLSTTDSGQGLRLGKEVRVIRAPYFGAIGEIVELPVQPQALETGALARVAKIKIKDNIFTVPRANLEVMVTSHTL